MYEMCIFSNDNVIKTENQFPFVKIKCKNELIIKVLCFLLKYKYSLIIIIIFVFLKVFYLDFFHKKG